mmetsp:Transcript_20535/g.58594  ORF Transcript_20535/g.58594 Transcript_20535/m.58594 type:complete len:307 (+) Transcript_20535:120-1040(+)
MPAAATLATRCSCSCSSLSPRPLGRIGRRTSPHFAWCVWLDGVCCCRALTTARFGRTTPRRTRSWRSCTCRSGAALPRWDAPHGRCSCAPSVTSSSASPCNATLLVVCRSRPHATRHCAWTPPSSPWPSAPRVQRRAWPPRAPTPFGTSTSPAGSARRCKSSTGSRPGHWDRTPHGSWRPSSRLARHVQSLRVAKSSGRRSRPERTTVLCAYGFEVHAEACELPPNSAGARPVWPSASWVPTCWHAPSWAVLCTSWPPPGTGSRISHASKRSPWTQFWRCRLWGAVLSSSAPPTASCCSSVPHRKA